MYGQVTLFALGHESLYNNMTDPWDGSSGDAAKKDVLDDADVSISPTTLRTSGLTSSVHTLGTNLLSGFMSTYWGSPPSPPEAVSEGQARAREGGDDDASSSCSSSPSFISPGMTFYGGGGGGGRGGADEGFIYCRGPSPMPPTTITEAWAEDADWELEDSYVQVEKEDEAPVVKEGWLQKQSFHLIDGRPDWKRHFVRWKKVGL